VAAHKATKKELSEAKSAARTIDQAKTELNKRDQQILALRGENTGLKTVVQKFKTLEASRNAAEGDAEAGTVRICLTVRWEIHKITASLHPDHATRSQTRCVRFCR
jgi:hypothetical protein